MKVLVACEESQRVCMAFRERGHNAFSCDIEPCSGCHPEWHIQQDVLPLLNGRCGFKTMDGVEHSIDGKWDLIIAHPPCTYLSNAGARFLYPKGVLNQDRLESGLAAKEVLWLFTMLTVKKSVLRILRRHECMGCRNTHRSFSRGCLGTQSRNGLVFGLKV